MRHFAYTCDLCNKESRFESPAPSYDWAPAEKIELNAGLYGSNMQGDFCPNCCREISQAVQAAINKIIKDSK